MKSYVSAFANWHSHAWVRSKPEHTQTGFSADLDFFPASLAMTLRPPVDAASLPGEVRQALLVQELYGYLTFTTQLEVNLVSTVCRQLVHRSDVTNLDPVMRRDFLRTFADEAGHAEMCEEMMLAVEGATGIARLRPHDGPRFMKNLRALAAARDAQTAKLVPLLAVVVSETLLSPTLVRLPMDESVQAEVRALVRDHASDEVRHAALFRVVFRHLWHQWDDEVRRAVLRVLPDVIDALLDPDPTWVAAVVSQHPDLFDDPVELAQELVGSHKRALAESDTLAPVMALLDELEALEGNEAAEVFLTRGLSPARR